MKKKIIKNIKLKIFKLYSFCITQFSSFFFWFVLYLLVNIELSQLSIPKIYVVLKYYFISPHYYS